MKRLYALLLSIFLPANFAHSTIISGDHYLDDGRQVNLQGLEWLSLSETFEHHKGYLDKSIFDDFPGWRYATISEVTSLFASFESGASSDTDAKWLIGAEWFANTFGVTDGAKEYGGTASNFFYGSEKEVNDVLNGNASDKYRSAFYFGLNINYDIVNNVASEDPSSANLFSQTSDHSSVEEAQKSLTSHMLVKVAHAPEPSTLALFSVGLLAITARRSRSR